MIVWVAIRRVLALGIGVLLWNRWVTLGVLAIGIVGFVGVSLLSGFVAKPVASGATGSPRSAAPVVQSAGGLPPPAPAVEAYVQGMLDFDASLMWSAMDAESIAIMEGGGGSIAMLQKDLDEMRRAGARYDDVAYVGAYPLADGGAYFFYVVSRRGFVAANALDQVYFVFTVGPDGRIASIE